MPEMLLVQTSAGNFFVSPHTLIKVALGEGRYAEKYAHDLNEGDMVLVSKEYVRLPVTLEEVDAILCDNLPRYRNTFANMFEFNSRGERIPRLRCELIRGLGAKRIVQEEKAKTLKESGDYEPAEYAAMTGKIAEVIENARTPETIRGWLRGDILAPSELSVLAKLSVINGVFADMAREESDFAKSYAVYVTIRRGVMRGIASPKAVGAGQTAQHEHTGRTRIKDALGIVRNHFISEIDEQVVAASAGKIIPLEKKSGECAPAGEGVFPKKIVTTKLERVNMEEVYALYLIASEMMQKLTEKYYNVDFITADLILYLLCKQLNLKHPDSRMLLRFYEELPEKAQNTLRLMAADLMSEIEQGGENLPVPGQHAQNLLNMLERSLRVLPSLYHASHEAFGEWVRANFVEKADRKKRRELERKLEKIEDKLKRKYNIDKNYSKKLVLEAYRGLRRVMLIMGNPILIDPYTYKEDAEKKAGMNFFTRNEVVSIAKKYGIEEFIGLIEKNFLSEDSFLLNEFRKRNKANEKAAAELLREDTEERRKAVDALAERGEACYHVLAAMALSPRVPDYVLNSILEVFSRVASPRCLEVLVLLEGQSLREPIRDKVAEVFGRIADNEKNHPLVRQLARDFFEHATMYSKMPKSPLRPAQPNTNKKPTPLIR
ncbi:MAG: hypothetical protein QXH27_05065 [Candidatus Micrarchaeia archaeon]